MESISPTIIFYYDVMSPYSFLAFRQLQHLRTFWPGIAVEYRPVPLFYVVKAAKNHAPSSVLAKYNWLYQDLQRAARDLRITDFKVPRKLFNTRNALLLLTTLRDDPPTLISATSAIYDAIFIQAQYRDTLPVLKEVLSGVVSSDVLARAIEAAQSQPVMARLQTTADEALEQGAFGLPVLIVHPDRGQSEFFFGSDRFHQIAQVLRKPWPLPVAKSNL